MKRTYGSIFKKPETPGYYWVRVRRNGKQKVRKAGTTVASADRLLRQLEAEEKREAKERVDEKPITFADFVTWYGEFIQQPDRLSPETIPTHLCTLSRWSGILGDMVLADVEQKHIVRTLDEQGGKPATRNRHLAVISGMFTKAVKRGMIAKNPCAGIGREKSEEKPRPYLSPEDQQAFVDACPSIIRPIVIVALGTGMRRGEIRRLSWADVHGREVYIPKAKGKRARTIHASKAAAAVLAEMRAARTVTIDGDDPVFPGCFTELRGELIRPLAKALRTAGTVSGFRLTLQSFRHIRISSLVRAGVPLVDVQKIAGHRAITTTLGYACHAPKNYSETAADLADAWMESERSAPKRHLRGA